jgi:hypothetical protein
MLLLIFSPNFAYTLTDPDVGVNDFTIVIIPDSQKLVQESPSNNELWKQQLQWIVNNKDTLKIKFVMHVGDMVHHTNPDSTNPNNPGIDQWYWAQRATAVLDGNVPWLPGVGNHEFWDGDTWHYNQAYPYTEFTGWDYYQGHYPSNKNDSMYGTFTAEGIDFLCISVRDSAKVAMTSGDWNWVNNVISNNTDKLVIYVTHSYLSKGANDVGGQSVRNGIGNQHWNNVISNYSNIMMVHCGHLGTLGSYAYRRVDYISGKPVH